MLSRSLVCCACVLQFFFVSFPYCVVSHCIVVYDVLPWQYNILFTHLNNIPDLTLTFLFGCTCVSVLASKTCVESMGNKRGVWRVDSSIWSELRARWVILRNAVPPIPTEWKPPPKTTWKVAVRLSNRRRRSNLKLLVSHWLSRVDRFTMRGMFGSTRTQWETQQRLRFDVRASQSFRCAAEAAWHDTQQLPSRLEPIRLSRLSTFWRESSLKVFNRTSSNINGASDGDNGRECLGKANDKILCSAYMNNTLKNSICLI